MKDFNLTVTIVTAALVVAALVGLFYFDGNGLSIIQLKDWSIITYNKSGVIHSYDCSSDSIDFRHNSWANQQELLMLCKMCVLEQIYPKEDPRAQMYGDCEWWTSSTTGDSRYRYRAIPLDGTNCGDIDIKGNATAEHEAQTKCYQDMTFAQLTQWAIDTNYCPNNPEAYIKENMILPCKYISQVNETQEPPKDGNDNKIPIWYVIIAVVILIGLIFLLTKFFWKRR